MAVRTVTQVSQGTDWRLYKWEGLLNGDTGSPLKIEEYSDATIHLIGTFGSGGSLTLYGSCIPDDYSVAAGGGTWLAVTDPQANAITKTAAAIETVLEAPMYLAPKATAGDGTTDLDLYIKITRR